MVARAATTSPATKTPSRSAPAWPIGDARGPTNWPSSRSRNTSCAATATSKPAEAEKLSPKTSTCTTPPMSARKAEEGRTTKSRCSMKKGATTSTLPISIRRLGYFMEKLFGHEREGFIWQKLRARSYDYKKTENKGYNERLRMPQFNIDPTEREQVITFVLGLVAEPPAQQYVYKPTPRRKCDRRRLEGHRQVQLQRLPCLPDGPLGLGLCARAILPIRPSSTTTPSSTRTSRRSKSPPRSSPTAKVCGTPPWSACRSTTKRPASRNASIAKAASSRPTMPPPRPSGDSCSMTVR